MSAVIHVRLPISPTALVGMKAAMAETIIVPGCKRVHLAHRPLERRLHHGMVELALGFGDRRLGLEIFRCAFGGLVGVAA